jgi:hypothetical protein
MEDNNLINIDPHIPDDYITKDGGATNTEVNESQEESEDNKQQDDDDSPDLMDQDNNDSDEETSCDEEDDYELYDEDSRGKDDERQDEAQQNDPPQVMETSEVTPLWMRRSNRQHATCCWNMHLAPITVLVLKSFQSRLRLDGTV